MPRVTGPWQDETIGLKGPDLLQLGSMEFRPANEINQDSLDFILREP